MLAGLLEVKSLMVKAHCDHVVDVIKDSGFMEELIDSIRLSK